MELRTAKLCLDCEEVHAEQMCPVCASESFAYLTRWIPIADRPQERRSQPVRTPPVDAPPNKTSIRWARRGAAGVVLVAISQWLWRNTRPVEWTESGTGQQDDPDK
jgi:hypothetical protein